MIGIAMRLPTYDQFILPILRFLAAHPEGASRPVIAEAAADALQLTDADRQELLPSGNQLIYRNRAGWALDRLKRAGFASNLERGVWKSTADGLAFLTANHADPRAKILELTEDKLSVRLNPNAADTPAVPLAESTNASPDDRLGQALAELRDAVVGELRDQLARVSPSFFEPSSSTCSTAWATAPAGPTCSG